MSPDDLSGGTTMANPERFVGTWRRFGPIGPVYRIVAAGAVLNDGDRLMRVRVVESDEEVDYRLSQIVADPHEG